MDYSKTGRLIAKKRKDRDYTLEDLSKLLGVSPQAISLWENGKRYPDPSSQVMLFKVLSSEAQFPCQCLLLIHTYVIIMMK